MAHWIAAIDGRQRNSSLHPRHCSDVFVPASCCRNWACLVISLRTALLILYCAAPVCSCIRTRLRVQFPTNAGIPLADADSSHFSGPCSCVLPVHSAVRNERSETNSAPSVTVETSPLHSKSPGTVLSVTPCLQQLCRRAKRKRSVISSPHFQICRIDAELVGRTHLCRFSKTRTEAATAWRRTLSPTQEIPHPYGHCYI
jgi:hypothetical protein